MVLTRTGPVWVLLACLHDALAAWTCAHWCWTAMGVATLVLCLCAISWPHTSSRVCGLQPFTLVPAHSHHARPLITPGTCEVDCTVPRSPISCQCSPVRPRPALSVHLLRISPIRPAPSCCLCGLVFLVLRPDQSSHLSSGKPPAASWIFPVRHSYPALVSINPSVDLRVHCVVHLAQGPLSLQIFGSTETREGCQGCGASPELRNQMLCPRRAVRRRPILWAERDANKRFPKEKITSSTDRTD